MKLRLAAAAALLLGVSTPALASARLPEGVRPITYDITVTPNAQAMSFSGRETVRVAVARPTRTVVLNANDITLGQVTFDGRQVPFAMNAEDQQVTVTLPGAARAGEHVMTFTWNGRINTTAAGFFAIDYTNDNGSRSRMLLTQFEAPDARRFAPMWDEPAFKARFTLNVMAPGDQTAFSNMPADSVTRVGANRLYRFRQSPEMSSYLLFLGIGDIERRTVMAGPTEIGIITRRGVADRGSYALAQARQILAYYNDYFGQPYPLPKLDMIAAPGGSQVFGAMENWGAIFYFEQELLFDPVRDDQARRERIYTVIAHEMAHQWFGDLVTMRWWDDLWLNEGFASWMESRATNDLNPSWQDDAATVAGSREGALNIDATAASHPIIRHVETVDQVQEAFDGITYAKGEAVIRMLESTLGRDAFRAGVRRYMARYHYGNTVTDQLWAELEAAAGRPVTQIAHDFTLQQGVPLVSLTGATCQNGRTTAMLTQTRFGLDAASRQPQTWHVPMTLGVVGQPTTSAIVTGATAQPVTVAGCGTLVLNVGKGSYMRARYDDASHAAIVRDFTRLSLNDQLGTIGDDYALALSGDQPLARYLAVQDQVRPDADPLLWQTVAGKLASMRILYNRTPLEQPIRQRIATILRPVFDRVGFDARPGESTQTANLRNDLIAALAADGDTAVAARVRGYVAALGTNPRAIPAPIRQTVLAAFAFNANASDWDLLRAMEQSENDPVARNALVQLLGVARDDAQAQRALTLLSGSDLTDPQKASLLQTIASNHPDLAFDYAVAHQAQVNTFVEGVARSAYTVGLGRGSNDPAMPGKITSFAEGNIPAASRRPAEQAVLLIGVRRANADRLRSDVAAWLGQPAG